MEMKQKIKKIWKKNKETILLLGGILAVYFVLSLFEIPTCPMKVFLGIPCPGCGVSRALMSVLRLDFAAAFEFNPLWPAVIVTAILLAVFWIKEKTLALEITGIVFLVIAVAVYIYRVAFTDSSVVAWNFESGLIYRGYVWITGFFNR